MTAVWEDIEAYVTRGEAEAAVAAAAAELAGMLAVLPAREARTVCYGWSGGKDSQALRVVCERAGVERAIIGLVPEVEWPAYLDWMSILAHIPPGLTRYCNPDVTLRFLAGNPQLVFPSTARLGYFWTLAGTRRAQTLYQREWSPPFIIHGRRRSDGNVIRDKFGPGLDPAAGGGLAYCPIRDWAHELTLAVVHYAGLPLPPVYSWPHGWSSGTGAWPGRRPGGWAETHAIDPGVVERAAAHFPAAARFLADS